MEVIKDLPEVFEEFAEQRKKSFLAVKELKDFARISLEPGETKTVEFTVTPDKLRFLDKNLKPIVEPGEFIVMAGPSSADEDLLKTSFFVK